MEPWLSSKYSSDLSGAKQIIDVFRSRSTEPRNGDLGQYTDEICGQVNGIVNQFGKALKPPLAKFHSLYSNYFG